MMASDLSELEHFPREVSFGITRLTIARGEEIQAAQLGYSINSEGRSLAGQDDGDWRSSWIVIGKDCSLGDPVFIDSAHPNNAVYKAAHGQGRWDPIPVASSLQNFRTALEALSALSRGREHPVALESNPLTLDDRQSFLSLIRDQNGDVVVEFWSDLLDAS
jgi:hypothetical protein